jgi:hypothetical protein
MAVFWVLVTRRLVEVARAIILVYTALQPRKTAIFVIIYLHRLNSYKCTRRHNPYGHNLQPNFYSYYVSRVKTAVKSACVIFVVSTPVAWTDITCSVDQ